MLQREYKYHTEEATRGHCRIKVAFANSMTWSIVFQYRGSSVEPTHKDKRHRRGWKKAKRIVVPIATLWATSDYKYIIDLQDFVTATLGKPGNKR